MLMPRCNHVGREYVPPLVYMIDHIWGDYEDKDYVKKTDAWAYRAQRNILHILCDHPDIDIPIKDNHERTVLHMVRV